MDEVNHSISVNEFKLGSPVGVAMMKSNRFAYDFTDRSLIGYRQAIE